MSYPNTSENIFCRFQIAYDGHAYLGWQDNGLGPTIESTLQAALVQVFGASIDLQAASRTDAGVHAHAQIVTAEIPSRYPLGRLKCSLNKLLPPDIRITSLTQTAPFHPSLDVISKTYHYSLCTGPIQAPHRRFTSWHTGPLDSNLIQAAIPHLLGTHNFSAFANRSKERADPTLTLHAIELTPSPHQLLIALTATRFLYRMARNLAGTLVQVGRNQLTPTDLSTILAAQKRSHAGLCAPAHGLTLAALNYP